MGTSRSSSILQYYDDQTPRNTTLFPLLSWVMVRVVRVMVRLHHTIPQHNTVLFLFIMSWMDGYCLEYSPAHDLLLNPSMYKCMFGWMEGMAVVVVVVVDRICNTITTLHYSTTMSVF